MYGCVSRGFLYTDTDTHLVWYILQLYTSNDDGDGVTMTVIVGHPFNHAALIVECGAVLSSPVR